METQERHICESRALDSEGLVIEYLCPLCPGWRRVFNLKKGVMETSDKERYSHVLHSGTWSRYPELVSVSTKIQVAKKPTLDFNPN